MGLPCPWANCIFVLKLILSWMISLSWSLQGVDLADRARQTHFECWCSLLASGPLVPAQLRSGARHQLSETTQLPARSEGWMPLEVLLQPLDSHKDCQPCLP